MSCGIRLCDTVVQIREETMKLGLDDLVCCKKIIQDEPGKPSLRDSAQGNPYSSSSLYSSVPEFTLRIPSEVVDGRVAIFFAKENQAAIAIRYLEIFLR